MQSKVAEQGGVPGVVTPEPEIVSLTFTEDLDFALLASDGVFDVLSCEEVNEVIWKTIRSYKANGSPETDSAVSDCLNDCVNNVFKRSMLQNSKDNLTVILIAFKNFWLN